MSELVQNEPEKVLSDDTALPLWALKSSGSVSIPSKVFWFSVDAKFAEDYLIKLEDLGVGHEVMTLLFLALTPTCTQCLNLLSFYNICVDRTGLEE
mmetsp:Transcript_4703/g.5930  ORF Transcript_4703/g.5930 Transcript_4703/m.5930 type:complete len:96 (-) Transcript_4703:656-943(-)